MVTFRAPDNDPRSAIMQAVSAGYDAQIALLSKRAAPVSAGPFAGGGLRQPHADAFNQPKPENRIMTALTDTRFHGLDHGIPALRRGPVAENTHGFDERADLGSVKRAAETIALFIASWRGRVKA